MARADMSPSCLPSSANVRNGFTGATCAHVAITAISATSISIEFAINRITRSPRFTPADSKRFASPAAARPSSAYVMRCCSKMTAG